MIRIVLETQLPPTIVYVLHTYSLALTTDEKGSYVPYSLPHRDAGFWYSSFRVCRLRGGEGGEVADDRCAPK